MILLIDNFDSFTYNLQDYLKRKGHVVKTIRYNNFNLSELKELNLSGIVISPGPGKPTDYPKHYKLFSKKLNQLPVLGVCLGFQSIATYYGGKLSKGTKPMHGKISKVFHNQKAMFKGIDSPTEVTRYHSLIINELPKNLDAIANTIDNELMAFRSKNNLIWGVQFHPEAHLTTFGDTMIMNWLNVVDSFKKHQIQHKEQLHVVK
ncbi:MAG: anthranilate synthase component II [Bacteroidia bacterium]